MILCFMNFRTCVCVMLAYDAASTHFVKESIATRMNETVSVGSFRSDRPNYVHTPYRKGHGVVILCSSVAGALILSA